MKYCDLSYYYICSRNDCIFSKFVDKGSIEDGVTNYFITNSGDNLMFNIRVNAIIFLIFRWCKFNILKPNFWLVVIEEVVLRFKDIFWVNGSGTRLHKYTASLRRMMCSRI